MSEPLDLEPIRKRDAMYSPDDETIMLTSSPYADRRLLLVEVERLRGEVARQAEQITAIRALHRRMVNNENVCDTCTDHRGLYLLWPCPTLKALDGDS